jgi:hypothetical protein
LVQIQASNEERRKEARSSSRPLDQPGRARSRPPAPRHLTPQMIPSSAPPTPELSSPNWDGMPSPSPAATEVPSQKARGAAREFEFVARDFELKMTPGVGETLSRAIRRSSQSRKRSTSVTRGSKMPRYEDDHVAMRRSGGPRPDHMNTPEQSPVDEVKVEFGREHIATILAQAREKEGELTLDMLEEFNMIEVLGTFLDDEEELSDRVVRLNAACLAYTLQEHKSTWSSYKTQAANYRKWCAKKGWTYDTLSRCYA